MYWANAHGAPLLWKDLEVERGDRTDRVCRSIWSASRIQLMVEVPLQFAIPRDRKRCAHHQFGFAEFAEAAVVEHLESRLRIEADRPDRELSLGRKPVPVSPGVLAVDDAEVNTVSIREQHVAKVPRQRIPRGGLQETAVLR
jgi:hypothetical protein